MPQKVDTCWGLLPINQESADNMHPPQTKIHVRLIGNQKVLEIEGKEKLDYVYTRF